MTQGAEAQSADRARYELAELVETARALASERDIKKLLAVILRKCRQVTGADAGSVYVVEDGESTDGGPPARLLHFMLSQNDSLSMDLQEFRLPIDERSIVGRAVLHGTTRQVPFVATPVSQ